MSSQVPPSGPPSAGRQALKAPLDGTLAEYQISHESGLVAAPESLSFEEAAEAYRYQARPLTSVRLPLRF